MTRIADRHDFLESKSPARVENPCHRKDICFALLVGLITFLVFCPVLIHGFVDAWDDDIAITNNPDYNPPTISKLLHYWVPPPKQEFYVPVTYTLWGLVAMAARTVGPDGAATFNPLPFHAINLAAHTLSAVLVFLILRQLVPNRWAAFIGALVFALHPIQVEAVAWASSMYTPLCGMLSLAAIWQFLLNSTKREAGNNRRTRAHYGMATLFFLLAMLTKPAAASVPLIVAAIEIGWHRRKPGTLALPLGLWILLCIPIIAVTKLGNPASAVSGLAPWQKLVVGLDAMAFYLYKIVWPARLCPDYGRSPNWLLGHPVVWVMCLVPIILFIIVRLLRLRIPWLNAAAATFAAALLPTLGLASFSFQAFSTVADRYAYLAMLAIAMIAAMLLSRAAVKALVPLAIVIVIGLGTPSIVQLSHWRNAWTLFAHTLETNPGSRIVAGNTRFLLTPRTESHCTLSSNQLVRMADLLLRQRRSSIAADVYRLAMSKGTVNVTAYNNLAIALLQNEKFDEARAACREALRRDRKDAAAHAILGDIYIRSDSARAADEYRQALALDPANADARRGLAALQQK